MRYPITLRKDFYILKDNFESSLFSDLSKTLNRTESAIRAKCFDLNLFKNTPWTDDEINFVKENYVEMKTATAVRRRWRFMYPTIFRLFQSAVL